MGLPFTAAEFMEVFARYNAAVWPAQPLLLLVAVAGVGLALRPRARGGAAVGVTLAFLWAWMGVVYHLAFFRAINPAATVFAAGFVLQAALLLHAAAVGTLGPFRPRADAAGIAGAALVAYALVGYPLLGMGAGQVYPRAPTFGLPCPTTIFTFGVLLWAERGVPARLLAVPAAWAVIGTVAAVQLAVPQDFGLTVAGVVGTVLLVGKDRRLRPSARRAQPPRPGTAWRTG